MKQYLIPISIVLVLILGVIGGCSQKPEQVHELSTKDVLTPKVIEKDVIIKYQPKEVEWLRFNLKVGDRVEGEVSLNKDALEPMVFEATGRFVIGIVTDPYGNTIVERDAMTKPWRFAFIAYTNGEYGLRVKFSGQVQSLVSAHVKITCYEGELSPTRQFK